jgi:hypothetical protein
MGFTTLHVHNFCIQTQIEKIKQKNCNPRRNLSNAILHDKLKNHLTIFPKFVVGNQTIDLTPNSSFGHNVNFKTPNGEGKPACDIDTLKYYIQCECSSLILVH